MVLPDQGLRVYRWWGKSPDSRRFSVPYRFIKSFRTREAAQEYASQLIRNGTLLVRVKRYTIYNGNGVYFGVYAAEHPLASIHA